MRILKLVLVIFVVVSAIVGLGYLSLVSQGSLITKPGQSVDFESYKTAEFQAISFSERDHLGPRVLSYQLLGEDPLVVRRGVFGQDIVEFSFEPELYAGSMMTIERAPTYKRLFWVFLFPVGEVTTYRFNAAALP